MREVLAIARRELAGFFASLSAFLFLAVFVALTLFLFFWSESFFARNIADIRPLFDWLAPLQIFLAASLTMRSWSEERRSGAIELLLTSPVSSWRLVLGKFVAVMTVIVAVLFLTLPIPVMVAFSGNLDWGAVAGGYIGILLLASSCTAIGLFVSSKTDNPIVSLIGTIILCGLFYFIGHDSFTAFFGYRTAEWLGYFSSSTHVLSMMRGVIDLNDLLYFTIVTLIFLALNRLSLESLRPAGGYSARHGGRQMLTGLLIIGLVLTILFVNRMTTPRFDLTENSRYTLSGTTRETLANLEQPLLLRAYFSERTHPLLNALVPQMQHLLEEYRIAAGGMVRIEIVDPHRSPEHEQEAAEKYAIEPTPFQTADRYQASLVSSYFDILVEYGGQFQTLNYADLIEIKTRNETDLDVRLRNPEYDLTAAIRKVLFAQRTHENLFDSIPGHVRFRGFISDDTVLPEKLVALKKDLKSVLDVLAKNAGGKLAVSFEDPQAGDGALVSTIREEYGFRPMVISVDSKEKFFFYMLFESDSRIVPVPLPDSLDVEGLQKSLTAGLRNFAPGVLRKVALVLPPEPLTIAGFKQKGYATWFRLEKQLRDSVMVEKTDLAGGQAPANTDLLLIVEPDKISPRQLFAIDQFLMQGGAVIVATSPWRVKLGSDSIEAEKLESGLQSWLAHHGITLPEALVMDSQLSYFPIPVERQIGSRKVEEIRQLAYPYFIDLREEGLDESSGIFAGLGQLTLNWVSPVEVENGNLRVTTLFRSSDESWLDETAAIQPDFEQYPDSGFSAGDNKERQSHVLGVMARGSFQSWFKENDLPAFEENAQESGKPLEHIERSPDDAMLTVIGSGIFLADSVIDLQSQASGSRYLNSLQFIQNLVDRVFEEPGLLELRGRGDYARILDPLSRQQQKLREYVTIAVMFGGVVFLFTLARLISRRRTRYLQQRLKMNE